MSYEVMIINPRNGGTVATPRRNTKGRFVKGGSTRRSNPKRRRRRSVVTGAPMARTGSRRRRRGRRRRNPDGGGGGGSLSIGGGFKDLAPVLAARLFIAWVMRTWGAKWGNSMLTGAAMPASPYQGQAWPFGNHAFALLLGYLAALALRKKSGHFAAIFWKTICADVVTRIVWTEGFTRIPGAQNYFGNAPGTIWRDGSGNTWQQDQWGRWQTMQGTLDMARPLDGDLDWARPLDGLTGARGVDVSYGGYGGRVNFETPSHASQVATSARYTGTGNQDRYAAAYQ